MVKAVHVPTGAKYGGVTRKNGRYAIKGMRVGGPYTVTFSFVGYNPVVREGVTIVLGDETEVNVELEQTAAVAKEVVVTAKSDKVFNPNKNGSGSTISEEDIAASPSINRSLSDIARVNPYTSQTSTLGSDDGLQGVSIAGVNSRFNNIQIDGAVANDIFGLGAAGTAGSQANANLLSLDAIQELQVNVSPYDIRQSGFTGGLVNAITRGGTNKYKGSVFAYGRNEYLVGLSPDDVRQRFSQFQDFQFGGRVGGPIIENQMFFHLTTEVRLRNKPLELALNDPNALNNFPYPKSTIDEIVTIAKQRYGYDAGNSDAFISRNNTYNVIARLDWNIDENNKLQLRHNYTNAFQDRNVQRTSRIFGLSSQWNEFRSINNSSVMQLNSLVGDNIANELRLSFTQTNDERYLHSSPFPQVKVLLSGNESVLMGPERNSQANTLDQSQFALTNDLSFFLEDHIITVGTHNESYRFNNLFITDYYGNYTFRDVQAFRDGTPSFYQLSYANLATTSGDSMPRAAWSMMQSGLYVMDEWKALPELRITGGIRVDVPIYLTKPLENHVFANRFDALAMLYNCLEAEQKQFYTEIPEGLFTSRLPTIQVMPSPRIGFNYDPNNNKKFVLRGGTGLFTGRIAAVWLSNQFGNTGVDLYRISVGTDNSATAGFLTRSDSAGKSLVVNLNPYKPPKPGDGTFAGQNEQTSAINVTTNDFKLPQVWRSTIATDIRLGEGISATIEAMYSKSLNQVDFRNINLRRSLALPVSPVDGRPLYARSGSGRTDSNAAKEFTQVILMGNRDEGYQYSAMATMNLDANNPYIPGFSALLSYVHSAAYDLADATSSTASSNWQNTDIADPNNATLARSNFDVPHRFVLNASYRFNVIEKATTTIGLFYAGNSGRPYGFTYLADLNGDGVTTNDLIYVPKAEDYNSKVVIVPPGGLDLRTADQIWEQMMTLIDRNPILKKYQGQILPRNAMSEPFMHQLDLRLSQQIPTTAGQNLELTLDIQNVLNLLNREWGMQKYVNFQGYRLFALTADADGDYYDNQGRLRMSYSSPTLTSGKPGIYDTDNFLSRWRMQLGIRYSF